jgi:hypothetical protein
LRGARSPVSRHHPWAMRVATGSPAGPSSPNQRFEIAMAAHPATLGHPERRSSVPAPGRAEGQKNEHARNIHWKSSLHLARDAQARPTD